MKHSTIAFSSLLIISILFYNCSTPYQSYGFLGGFTDTQLDENIFRVHFNGNGYTSTEKASDYCLLRCAELTLQSDYNYFIIVSNDENTSISSYTTPTTTKTKANASVYGNTVSGTATSTTYGGQTYYITKPSSTNLIICYSEKPDMDVMVYNANFIFKSIKDKYDIE